MIRFPVASTCFATILAIAPIATSHAAMLENGKYRCVSNSFAMHLGDIEINGDVYRGPAYDGKYRGAYKFTVSPEGGIINWGGPLGGISEAGSVVSSQIRRGGFDIIIQMESGNYQTVTCFPD